MTESKSGASETTDVRQEILTGRTRDWISAQLNRRRTSDRIPPRRLGACGKNGKDRRSFAFAQAFGHGTDFDKLGVTGSSRALNTFEKSTADDVPVRATNAAQQIHHHLRLAKR